MFAPIRLFFAVREKADAGLLAAAASVAALFSSTPFLIPAVAADFGVTIGRAGLMSTAQVGAFALTTFVAGRRLRTHRRYLVGGAAGSVAFNLLSIVIPWFWPLLVVRALAGAAAGLLVWLSWANAMKSSGAMRNVAAVGPLTVFVAAPIVSIIADRGGADAVFAFLALAFVPPALLRASFSGFRPTRRRMSPSRSNVVLVFALGLTTLAGSSLFIFAAAIGASIGADPVIVAAAFSANALAGWFAARRSAGDRPDGRWVFLMAACAAAVAFTGSVPIFFVALTLWGFAFWMSTPQLLRAIAAWSLVPEERVGDAQSTMAVGRALGPAVASVLVKPDSFRAVGLFSVGGLILTTAILEGVRRFRASHGPPEGAVGS